MIDAPQFDPTDIRGILYEYRMMRSTADEMYRNLTEPTSPVVDFALIEACLVHVRNLHEFLGPPRKKRRPGDYHATDFVEGFEANVLDPNEKDKVDRWLQHLITFRYADEEHPEWDIVDLTSRVMEKMGLFLAAQGSLMDPVRRVHDCPPAWVAR